MSDPIAVVLATGKNAVESELMTVDHHTPADGHDYAVLKVAGLEITANRWELMAALGVAFDTTAILRQAA